MPGALLLRSQSTLHQSEGRVDWRECFIAFTLQAGKEKVEQLAHQIHIKTGYGASTLFLTFSTVIALLKSLTGPPGQGRGSIHPSASSCLSMD